MRETINDALVQLVDALGGAKRVGIQLWTELPIESAHRKLLDCLNEERPARLGPENVVAVLRMGRESGVHIGMEFLAAALEYEPPRPLKREIDIAEALRGYEETTDRLIDKLVAAQSEIKQLLASHKGQTTLRSAA